MVAHPMPGGNKPPMPPRAREEARRAANPVAAPPTSFPALRYDPEREAVHQACAPFPCHKCGQFGFHADGTPCADCQGMGMLMNRAQVAHLLISSDAYLVGGVFTLPLVDLAATEDPYWLAHLLASATANGVPLSPVQLLAAFDNIRLYSATFEANQPYWRLAAERIIGLVVAQLRTALPAGGGQ